MEEHRRHRIFLTEALRAATRVCGQDPIPDLKKQCETGWNSVSLGDFQVDVNEVPGKLLPWIASHKG